MTFRITYLDMKGREMDYEDYSLKVDIAPGLTRKVDVDAYENDRYYSYYKSEAYPLGARQRIKIIWRQRQPTGTQRNISHQHQSAL